MKFVHMADMHFGSTFTSLQGKNNYIQKRQLAQREAFDKIIQIIKDNNVEHFFIAGDLFEHESFEGNVSLSTIEYCNKKFDEIPNTKIWISPGNHDPYVKNSYYQTYTWAKNVTIFKDKVECYQTENCNIYGFGFSSFYEANSHIEEIVLNDKNKLNILITHADLDASKSSERLFNPISSRKLKEIGFDYVALGHIHKSNFSKSERFLYPGSTIGKSFGSGLGNHGIILGEINKDYYNVEYITLDCDFYIEIPLDISEIIDKEELIQEINNLYTVSESVYQIKLTGKHNFYIDTNEIKLDVAEKYNLNKSSVSPFCLQSNNSFKESRYRFCKIFYNTYNW